MNYREISKLNVLLVKMDYVSITHDWEPMPRMRDAVQKSMQEDLSIFESLQSN